MEAYLALVPIAQVVFEDLLLLCFEGLADTQPAATHSATDVADAAFLGELAGDILVRPALLLEFNDASVVIVVVGLDGLRAGSLATKNADVALVGETGAAVGVASYVVLLGEDEGSVILVGRIATALK